jgi:hypothetical protein
LEKKMRQLSQLLYKRSLAAAPEAYKNPDLCLLRIGVTAINSLRDVKPDQLEDIVSNYGAAVGDCIGTYGAQNILELSRAMDPERLLRARCYSLLNQIRMERTHRLTPVVTIRDYYDIAGQYLPSTTLSGPLSVEHGNMVSERVAVRDVTAELTSLGLIIGEFNPVQSEAS